MADSLRDLAGAEPGIGSGLKKPGTCVVGLGTASPLGYGVAAFWQSLFLPPLPPKRDAIRGFPDGGDSWCHAYAFAAQSAPECELSSGRYEELAVAAIEEACADSACVDAGIASILCDGLIVGVAIGTAAGETARAESRRLAGRVDSFAECNPYRVVDEVPEWIPLPINGPVVAIANACSASLYALAHAVDLIESGQADAMIVVGVDLLSRVTQAGFQKMTALDPERCRPFDRRRNGTVLGEGAAALVLVSSDVAACLPRVPYCRLLSSGASCDASHPTAPQPDGRDIRAALRRAFERGDVSSAQIKLVVPHGTGTPANDRIEGEAIGDICGVAGENVRVMPIKAHLGHTAGASGLFSVLAAAKALASRRVPPCLHVEQPDPDVPVRLDTCARKLCEDESSGPPLALVNAYGFGGSNLSVVMAGEAHG